MSSSSSELCESPGRVLCRNGMDSHQDSERHAWLALDMRAVPALSILLTMSGSRTFSSVLNLSCTPCNGKT